MYCHACGTGNTVDSKYCKECGVKINEGFRTMMLSVHDLPVNQTEPALEKLTRLLDMAFWHNEAGNVDAAITASEAALALNPNSTTAHSLLGTLYEKKGDDANAILHFGAVLALNPDSVADATKLDQLQRGVHVRPVPSPVAQQWLPPGLVKLAPKIQQTWIGFAGSGHSRTVSRRPLYAAGAASLVVLALGLLVTHPWAQAETVATYPIVTKPAPTPAVTVGRSAFAGSLVPSVDSFVKPMILTPNHSNSATSEVAPPLTNHDPFLGSAPVGSPISRHAASTAQTSAPASNWSLPPVPPRSAASARRRRMVRRELPALPLTLTAIPDGDPGGLAPAPVSVPDSARPLATVGSIPQHTVVVSAWSTGAGSADGTGSVADLPSHIHITVHQIKSSDSGPSDASMGGTSGEGAKGEAYQQRALTSQQQGEYGQARIAYQNAIRAYEAQLASGRDVETARRGLAACQTGLQICLQSQ